MAFTFDPTPSSATMNSYVSVADADDFFASKFIPADAEQWTSLTTPQKQALLCSATRVLDTFIYGGLKSSKTQPLQWPRSGMYDNEGTAYTSVAVPTPVRYAACEQAYWIWSEGARTLDDTTLMQFDDFKAGPLSVKIRKNPLAGISKDAIAFLNSMGIGTVISFGDTGGPKTMNMKL